MSYDVLPDYENASSLVEQGWLPVKGSVSSFGAYNPPGFAWVYLPGAWLFPASPGLAEPLGSAMLFGGTVAGIGLLLEATSGVSTTIGTVVMFAFSSIGLFYASSLWPRAHVFFYVWTVYFLERWALGRRPNACAAALATYLLGLYCFFEITPLGVLFLAVAVIYRPRIAPLSIVACVILMSVVWSPYLAYEVTRSGLDLRSFVTGAPAIQSRDIVSVQSSTGLPHLLAAVNSGILGNYRRGLGSLNAAALALATVCGLAFGSSHGRRLLERFLVPTAHLSFRALRLHRFLGLSLLAPWGLMLLLVVREDLDPGRRFFWFWALQIYFVGFSVFWIVPRLSLRRPFTLAAQTIMALAVLPVGMFRHELSDMRRSGYAGSGDRMAAVDCVAATLKAHSRTTASIGYELAVPSWQRDADGHFIFKVGNDYDLVFRRRHGIHNANASDIGFAAEDEFRIVELLSPDAFRDVPLRSGDLMHFVEIARYGNYWVGRRVDPAAALSRDE